MPADLALVASIENALAARADSTRAPQMQAYMKSTMPFLGVPVPTVRLVVRHEARLRPPTSTASLAATAARLWRSATYRELRYAATALTGLPIVRQLQRPELLPLYAEMIQTGAWWDHVDEVAHRIGGLLRGYPSQIRPVVVEWSHAEDRWLRRVSVICQLDAKEQTDLDLLMCALDANAQDPDFFVRKAIGWALREYAKTDPEWVRAFVSSRELSPLSRREALRRISR